MVWCRTTWLPPVLAVQLPYLAVVVAVAMELYVPKKLSSSYLSRVRKAEFFHEVATAGPLPIITLTHYVDNTGPRLITSTIRARS